MTNLEYATTYKKKFHQLFLTALKLTTSFFIIKISQNYYRNNEILKQLQVLEDLGGDPF